MKNIKIGRPKLNINEKLLKSEIEKYLKGEQKAVTTYQNLKIGKTSFYRILDRLEIKR